MEKEIEKKIGILSYIYDFINGGYFVAHHQLRFYDKEIYNLYLKNDKIKLNNLYNELKKDIPTYIIKNLEKSAGVRYFLCDGCHDAKIININTKEKDYKTDILIIELDTDGMLGCLNLGNRYCKIKIETTKNLECQNIFNDFYESEGLYWIFSNIEFEGDRMYFVIEVQSFKGKSYETLNYKFNIIDIVIE